MSSATTSSADSVIEPRPTTVTPLLALVSLALIREVHPEWTTASVAARAQELSISAERISRVKSAVKSQFEELVAVVSRRGRRSLRPDGRVA